MQTGFEPSWDGARQAQVAALGALGVPLTSTVYDGSGLSRRDRLSPATLAAVLAAIMDGQHPNLAWACSTARSPSRDVSGTLAPNYKRYVTNPTRCAAGLVEAKTGSLSGVISLQRVRPRRRRQREDLLVPAQPGAVHAHDPAGGRPAGRYRDRLLVAPSGAGHA